MANIGKGWTVAIASMVALIVSSTAITAYTQSIFITPLIQEYHWTRAQYLWGFSLGGVVAAFVPPVLGWAADRWGVKPVLAVGATLYAAANAWLGLISGSLTEFIVVAVVVGMTAQAQSPLLYAKAVSAWVDRNRGMALAIAMIGTGIGGVIVPLIANMLIEDYGWRIARFGLSALVMIVAVPAILLLIDEPNAEQRAALAARAQATVLDGETIPEAIRQKNFWLLAGLIFLGGIAVNGIITNIATIISDNGFSAAFGAQCVSVAAMAQIAGRLFSGFLLDRFRSPKIGVVLFLCMGAGIALLSQSVDEWAILVGVALYGLGLGSELELASYYTGRFFGLKHFGKIYGFIFGAFLLSNAIGPVSLGYSFDLFGSYNTAIMVMEVGIVLAMLCVLFLGPYRYRPPGK